VIYRVVLRGKFPVLGGALSSSFRPGSLRPGSFGAPCGRAQLAAIAGRPVTNGTGLNGRRIHAPQRLKKGDKIKIGHTNHDRDVGMIKVGN